MPKCWSSGTGRRTGTIKGECKGGAGRGAGPEEQERCQVLQKGRVEKGKISYWVCIWVCYRWMLSSNRIQGGAGWVKEEMKTTELDTDYSSREFGTDGRKIFMEGGGMKAKVFYSIGF